MKFHSHFFFFFFLFYFILHTLTGVLILYPFFFFFYLQELKAVCATCNLKYKFLSNADGNGGDFATQGVDVIFRISIPSAERTALLMQSSGTYYEFICLVKDLSVSSLNCFLPPAQQASCTRQIVSTLVSSLSRYSIVFFWGLLFIPSICS